MSDMFLEIQNLVGIIKYLKHIESVFLVNVFAKSFLKKQVWSLFVYIYWTIILIYNPNRHSPWWRHLEDVFRLHLQKTSSRRLQDVLIKTNIFALVIRLQKTSSRRLGQDQYIRLSHTSSRRLAKIYSIHLQDVLKTSSGRFAKTFSKRLQDVLQKHLQDIFKTSSRRFEDIFMTVWKRLPKISSRRFQEVSTS